MKLENDLHEHSKMEKLILVIVIALVVLVIVSWAMDEFAYSQEYKEGYNSGVREWNTSSTDLSHHFECPLLDTTPYSDCCIGHCSHV